MVDGRAVGILGYWVLTSACLYTPRVYSVCPRHHWDSCSFRFQWHPYDLCCVRAMDGSSVSARIRVHLDFAKQVRLRCGVWLRVVCLVVRVPRWGEGEYGLVKLYIRPLNKRSAFWADSERWRHTGVLVGPPIDRAVDRRRVMGVSNWHSV